MQYVINQPNFPRNESLPSISKRFHKTLASDDDCGGWSAVGRRMEEKGPFCFAVGVVAGWLPGDKRSWMVLCLHCMVVSLGWLAAMLCRRQNYYLKICIITIYGLLKLHDDPVGILGQKTFHQKKVKGGREWDWMPPTRVCGIEK